MPIMRSIQVFLIVVLMLSAGDASTQDEVEISVQQLSGTVYVLFGRGGNIAVSAGEDGVFLVDDQWAEYGEAIKAAIAQISDKPVRFVIHTHWHCDHTDGNKYFGESGAVIVAHENVRKRMSAGGYISAVDVDVPPYPDEALPIVTFNDSLSLYLNGEVTHVIYLAPGHTDGDAIIFFKDSNIIHTGDTFINGIYPLADLDSGGTIDGVIDAANTILDLVDDDTKIIPGHGPIANRDDLQEYRNMCIELRNRVAGLKKSGMSLEEVIASDPTAGFDEKWNSWGENWKRISVTALYREVTD